MNATRLVIVRHGRPEADSRGRCYGTLDVALSRRGVRDSEELAARLTSVPLSALYTSPRRRALATAEAIAAGRQLAPVEDERLRELDFGTFEGRTYAEIERDEPEVFRRWMTEPTAVTFPDGESFSELRTRVGAALDEYRLAHDGQTIAVVAHGGVVRAALAEVLSLPDERVFAIDVGYCRVSVVDWFGGDAVVRLVNGSAVDVPEPLGCG